MKRALPLILLVAGLVRAAPDDAAQKLQKIATLEWNRDPSVAKLAADEDDAVRLACARALGRIAAPGDDVAKAESASITRTLIARLAVEKERNVRRELLYALGHAGTREAALELIRIRDQDKGATEGGDRGEDDAGWAARGLRLAVQEADRPALVRGLAMRGPIAAESALTIGILERRLRAEHDATIDTATRTALLQGLSPERSKRQASTLYSFTFALAAMGDGRPDARAALVSVLASDAPEDARAEAARGLGRSAKADMEPPAELLADYTDARIATEVVHALARHSKSKAARARLVEILARHTSFHARREAAKALGSAGPEDDAEATAALETALEDSYKMVRASALVALAERNPAKGLAASSRFLEQGVDGRQAAASALGKLLGGPAKADALSMLEPLATSDPDHRVRMTALDVLGEEGDPARALALARSLVLKDEDPGIFETAAELLLEKAGPGSEVALLAGYARTRDKHDFFEAREEIVSGMVKRGAALTEAGKTLLELAESDPDPSVAAAASGPSDAPRARAPRKIAVSPRDWGGKRPVLVVETSRGAFEVELFPEVAPLHVANVVGLAERKFYDGLTWHRVESTFVIQGGCPRGDGSGDPGYTIPDELSLETYERGTLGMPKTAHKDTGGCQLFFTHGRAPHLEGRYTVFGRIRKGVEVVDQIEKGDTIDHVKVELEAR
ncbi:MAG TPA: peptidylprolyl isomerase [Planctomycetota bacterium]|nr:peptidylprolyl isomerase [Planctomycetota bacterium]